MSETKVMDMSGKCLVCGAETYPSYHTRTVTTEPVPDGLHNEVTCTDGVVCRDCMEIALNDGPKLLDIHAWFTTKHGDGSWNAGGLPFGSHMCGFQNKNLWVHFERQMLSSEEVDLFIEWYTKWVKPTIQKEASK